MYSTPILTMLSQTPVPSSPHFPYWKTPHVYDEMQYNPNEWQMIRTIAFILVNLQVVPERVV